MTKYPLLNLLFLYLVLHLVVINWFPFQDTDDLMVSSIFQSPISTPTDTATPIVTPTTTPVITATADVRSSSKMVNTHVAQVGDVLTYTITFVKNGGPGIYGAVADYLQPEVGAPTYYTYTHPVDYFNYSPLAHALFWTNDIQVFDVITLVYQVPVLTVPVGGILTNTALMVLGNDLVATPQAAVILETATTSPTVTPTPTATAPAIATATPSPLLSPTPTLFPIPFVSPDGGSTVTETSATGYQIQVKEPLPNWAPPLNWPLYLPETGQR